VFRPPTRSSNLNFEAITNRHLQNRIILLNTQVLLCSRRRTVNHGLTIQSPGDFQSHSAGH
jgi:hypothetical protein